MYYKQCWRLHHALQVKLEYNWVRGQFQNCPRNDFASKNKWTILRIIAISLLKSTVSWQLMSVFAISEREREMTTRWPDPACCRPWPSEHCLSISSRPAPSPPPSPPVGAQFASWLCRQKHLPGLRATSLRADPVFVSGFCFIYSS